MQYIPKIMHPLRAFFCCDLCFVVIMSAMASQITSLTIVYSTVYAGRSKKTSKLRATGYFAGNSPAIGEFPTQRANNAENVSIWWRHHVKARCLALEQPYNLLSTNEATPGDMSEYLHESIKLCYKVNHTQILCLAYEGCCARILWQFGG